MDLGNFDLRKIDLEFDLFHFPLTLKFCLTCLLYTSDAADERSSVDLGGRRIIKKKNSEYVVCGRQVEIQDRL